MKSFLSLILLLALFDVPSWSQTQAGTLPAPDTLQFDQSDLKKAQALERIEGLWNKRLDWKEKNSSTTDIAAHLGQVLGPDVTIEVRGKDDNISTFEISQAQLGPTLSSIVVLANTKLWVFPGRLLIAPKSLLTAEENDLTKAGMGGEWKESYTSGGRSWNAFNKFQQIALTLVGNDLKERFAAKKLTPNPPPPRVAITKSGTTGRVSRVAVQSSFATLSLTYELPLGDLSSSTKEILQILLDAQSPLRRQLMLVQGQVTADSPFSLAKMPTLSLDASTIVSFDDTQGGQLQLLLQQVDPHDSTKLIAVERWAASTLQPTPAS